MLGVVIVVVVVGVAVVAVVVVIVVVIIAIRLNKTRMGILVFKKNNNQKLVLKITNCLLTWKLLDLSHQ